MQFWNELEGHTVDGLFPLRRLIRSEGRSAWFETETPAPQAGRATISLTEALTDADDIAARLRAAQNLKHPNLVEIAQIGQVNIDNTQLVYAVMEPIEQSLSDVLQSQALTADEGREVAEALVGALTVIHQSGLSHGHVEAASVLATAERVKLRSDCLQSNTTGQAEDVVGIGGTLFHAFTQRKAATATDPMLNRIPAPFGEVVRNALAKRWTLAQIANALRPAPPIAVPPPPVAAPVPPAPAARRPEPAPVKALENLAPQPPVAPAAPRPAPPAPAQETPKALPPIRPVVAHVPVAAKQAPLFPDPEERHPAKRRPLALYGVLAIVLVALVAWLAMRGPGTPPAPTHTTPALSQPADTPAPAAPVATATAKPSAASASGPVRKPAAITSTNAGTSSSDRPVWRVIVYTYRGQSKADESVAKILSKHPDLRPSVFKPKGVEAYLVILGGSMDHPHATEMLAKARREGLPGDTFVRNYSE